MKIPFKKEIKECYPALVVYLNPSNMISYKNGKLEIYPKGYELATSVEVCKEENDKLMIKNRIEVRPIELLEDDFKNGFKSNKDGVNAYAMYYDPSSDKKITPWHFKKDNIISWVKKNIDDEHNFEPVSNANSLLIYIRYLIDEYYREDFQIEIKKFVDERIEEIAKKVKK